MIRRMNHGRCGPRYFGALNCLVLFTIITVFAIEAGQWDTAGAQRAFAEAEKEFGLLKQNPDATDSEYLHCARNYRLVYTRDPHYENSADSVYYEGLLYQKMGDLFDRQEYYYLAVKRFNFLVSDYGGNNNCPDALLRIGDIYTNKLVDAEKAREAYRILKNQYGRSKNQPPENASIPSPETPPGQGSAQKHEKSIPTGSNSVW